MAIKNDGIEITQQRAGWQFFSVGLALWLVVSRI
jgi:hypothetical protein